MATVTATSQGRVINVNHRVPACRYVTTRTFASRFDMGRRLRGCANQTSLRVTIDAIAAGGSKRPANMATLTGHTGMSAVENEPGAEVIKHLLRPATA